MRPNEESSKANREAAMWLAFVLVTVASGAEIIAVLIPLLQTPPLWGRNSCGTTFALITPFRRLTVEVIAGLARWG